jgi:hypothetical protein
MIYAKPIGRAALSQFALLLLGAFGPRQLDWHFVIPKDYAGFLILRFDCPGGEDLRISGHDVVVTFSRRGTARTRLSLSAFEPWVGE